MPILVTDTPEKKFIRLSVKDKGIVSVGVDENTKNTTDGSILKLSDIKTGKELTIEAVRLADTEMYDYRAEVVTIPSVVEMTVDERVQRLIKNSPGPASVN
jgi:hypothetical protein